MYKVSNFYYLILLAVILFSCSANQKKTVIENSSRRAFSFYYDALSDIEQGNFSQALSDLDSAIYYQPEYSSFYFVEGRVFEFLQQPDSAIKAYEQSIKLKSFYPEAWVRLGELYLIKRNYANATLNFKKAIQSYPDSINFYLKLGEGYFRLKKYRLALDCLKDYQQLAKSPSMELDKWKGSTYYGLGEYAKAANLLQKYIQSYPNDNEALKYLGLTEFKLGEYNQAISALNKASDSDNRDPEIYLYRARYFMVFDKMDDALEQLKIGLKYDSTNVDILFELGLFFYRKNDFKKSEICFKKIVKRNPEYWKAYRYLGSIAEQENNLEEALSNYKLFLKNTYADDPEVRQRIESIQKELQRK